MSKYLFSVIIPVYNAQKYLEACLASILSQSFCDFEIIVVNDGSTDNSENILNDYASKDKRIRVLHKLNQGPLLARVDAINLADSEYCVFVDSDDCLDPCFFDSLKNEIEVQDHDLFIYNYELISSEGIVIGKAESLFVHQTIFYAKEKKDLYKTIVEAKLNSLCIKAIKTNLLKKDSTDFSKFSDVFFGEDLLLSLYSLHKGESIKYLDLPLYKYRMSDGSICRSFNPRKIESILKVYKEMYAYVSVWENDSPGLHDLFIKTYGNTVGNFFASSFIQGAKFYETKNIIHLIRLRDSFYCEYLNNLLSKDFRLSMKQKILGLLFKYKQYFIIYSFYKMRHIVNIVTRKTL